MKSPVDALWDVLAETGKAIGDGFTIAAEILCPRDHTVEDRLRSWESAAETVEDEICDEAEAVDESEADNCSDFPCSPGCESWGCEYAKSSAADTAADPSPADNHHASRGAGDEGPEGASAIPPAAPSGQPTNAVAVCDVMDFRETHLPLRCTLDADHGGDHVAHGWGGQPWATWPQSVPADPESDPGAVTSPAPGVNTCCGICFGRSGQCDCTARLFGDSVCEDDLAAHIMGDFVSGQDVDPLTATLIDALSSRIARCLLADFHITRK